MAFKSIILFASMLLVIGLAAPLVEAQFGPILNPILGIARINGTVFCTNDANVVVNGTVATPVFPNAVVQLRLVGVLLATATTNASGELTILLNVSVANITTLIQNANVVLITPLTACNASLALPVGQRLAAPLQLIASPTLVGPLNVNLIQIGIGRFVPINV